MANTKITSRVIKDANVLTAAIADNAVTGDKVADDVALAGNPTTTTQSAGNNTTRLATTAFVSTAVSNLVASAPSALDTLNELAAAMGDDANFSTTVTNSIAAKLPLAGGTMSGALTISQSADLHTQFISNGGDSKLSIVSADSSDAWINLSGATNEISIGYERTSSEFRVCNADTVASNVRLAINSSTGNATFAGEIIANKALRLQTTDDQAQQWYVYTHTDDTLRINYNGAGSDALILHTDERMQLLGPLIVGGASDSQAGSVTLQADGDIRAVLASGAGGDTLISAISGVSNGFQILVDSSNNQSYKFHIGGGAKVTIDSSAVTLASNLTMMSNVVYASQVYVADRVGHLNDADTYMDFETNSAKIITGGKRTLTLTDHVHVMADQSHLSDGVYDMIMGAGAKAHGTFISPYMTLSTRYGSWDANIGCNARSNIGETSGGTEQATSYGGGGASNLYVGFTTLNWYHWSSSVTNTLGTNLPISSAYQMMVSDSGGNLNINGTYYNNASDRRLKDNITPISNAVDKVKQLTGNTFTWKTDDSLPIPEQYVGQKDVGVIAQEVQAVVPEAIGLSPWDIEYKEIDNPDYIPNAEPPIPQKLQAKDVSSESGNNYLTVIEEKLVPLLIEAIKEQQVIIDDLKARIETLEG